MSNEKKQETNANESGQTKEGSNLNLNLKDDISLSENTAPKPSVEKTPSLTSPPDTQANQPKAVIMDTPVDRVPANWIITPMGDGQIEARNSMSQKVFKGTIAEFNQALRG